jgi:prepilin-type N-terminal cleavage/methylation domain-containing protein
VVGQDGFSMMETMITIVIVGILAVVGFSGGQQELRFVGQSFAETKVGHLVSGRIERLRAADTAPVPGAIDFALPAEQVRGLLDPRGRQRVKELEVGLFEVIVEISWRPVGASRRRVFELTSWLEDERW